MILVQTPFGGRTLFARISCDATARQKRRARASLPPVSVSTHNAESN